MNKKNYNQSSAIPRVSQILYSGLGGHASVVFSILTADISKEWSSSLIFIGIEPVERAYEQRALELGVPYESIQTKPGEPWRSWTTLYSALLRHSPEIVILHSISSVIPVALYCFIHGARMIAVEHTPFDLRSNAEKTMSVLASLLSKRVVLLTNAYKKAYIADAFLFQRASKIAVIPNGVDMARFSMGEQRNAGSGGRIGMAARFTPKKRQDLLILALVHLIKGFPKVDWKISLAGDGDTLEALRRLAWENGVADRVEFVGYLEEIELISWFRTLDLYAHASEGEALSTSMLQAMSMGLPIVASEVPGIDDMLNCENEKIGILVTNNTPEAFAAEIAALYFSPDLRATLSELSRAEIVRKYSQESMFRAYNNLVMESIN